MDPATLAGIGIAVVSMLAMMLLEGADPMSIMLPAPLILVFGGTFGVAMAGGVLRDSLGIGKQIQRAIKSKPVPGTELVESIVKLAERARREGLLALEDAIKEVEEPFLRRGLELAIDGTDPEELREILEAEVEAKRKADKSGAKIFTDMGGYAPTIGIIGTVISLVLVLENLSDPSKLGHMIGAAFVATLWGVFSANVIWLPIGNRLKRLSELECAQMELTIEGIANIQAGTNPRLVSQKLRSLLPPGEAEEKKAA
ncbi:MotA/TolQ/ExbB proton channel family protein [Planomonospora sp. ID67723]|uniref:motility protein A n=1 Tax=Planomonospora sp. ID67723 TaxID=2738134 RepID=UPI0018C3FB83|nr:MotA/TolQ/ExbB proton channel family protein [Planomonospora sp. ID67723]MBG0833303.1 MotA/TolQ/ExbB proton channel family protein [Planomonospora sp. ID67723]